MTVTSGCYVGLVQEVNHEGAWIVAGQPVAGRQLCVDSARVLACVPL